MDFKTQNIDYSIDKKLFRATGDKTGIRRLGFTWIVVMGAMLFLSTDSVRGQYGRFTITPMKVEALITPGKTLNTVLNIQNLDPNFVHTIDLSLVDLTQSIDGEWLIVDTNDPNSFTDPNSPTYQFDVKRLYSCRSWIRLPTRSVTLQPLQYAPLELNIRVGRGQRGFHTAGILATVRPRPSMNQIPVSVRFLVPIVVEIETRPIRPKIRATDVGLEHVPAGTSGLATTLVTMTVQNDGGTLSQLKPIARIYAFSNNHWHVVKTMEMPEKRIIPGAILKLKADINKALPSGQYKVRGELYVDGRRTKPEERIFEFEGDPSINSVRADAPIDLNPTDLTVECSPGSFRAETITIYNASDETINIQTAKGLQSHLQRCVVDNVKGIDLDCTNWLKITPENFSIPGGGGRKNVQIMANLPTGAMYPCYYSLLALWATYPDGQKAGYRTANIFLKNSYIVAEPTALGLNIRLQELDESKFLVTTTFRNLKAVPFTPLSVKVGVIPTTGTGALVVPRLSTYMTGDPSPMLPFEDRTFSGELDFKNIPAGRYFLTGRLEYAPGQIEYTKSVIDVSIQGERRIVQTVGTQLELGGAVEVNW